MSQEPSQALVKANADAALSAAIQFWAEGSTRAETFERTSQLRDKVQAVESFFAFARKHPGDVSPQDVLSWRLHLEEMMNGRGLYSPEAFASSQEEMSCQGIAHSDV